MALISKRISKNYKMNLYIPKNRISNRNNIFLILFIFSILLIPNFSKLIKRQYYSILKSEIILKLFRRGNHTIISNHIDQVNSIYLNEVQITKNKTINCDKYRNVVRIVINQNINNCYGMFQNCYEIVEMDLSHFDASHVTDMSYMFYGCISLTSINFKGFDTSSVTSFMHYMFSNCNKLYSLDLSGFNTVKVECMENMFENCYSLTSLNLKNFRTTNSRAFDSMFQDCYKLEYINLYNAFTSNTNFKNGCSNMNCNDDWRKNQKKIIASNGNCISNCQSQNNNKFDILNKCYDSCTLILFFKDFCKMDYENKDIFVEDIINSLMNGTLYELLYNEINKGKNVIRYNYEEIIQISTLSNQNKETNLTLINFDEYLEVLKERYSFDDKDDPILLKIHNKLNNTTNFSIEYVLFYPDGKDRLDLNLCYVPNVKQYKSTSCDICLDYCYIKKFFENKCKIQHENKKILIEDIINSTTNGLLDNLLLNVIENKQNLIAENDTEIYQISTLSNQLKVRNSSYINLGECETLLKNENHFNQSEELILLLIEHNFKEIKIPIIEYIVFSPDGKQKLDLSVCKNITIHHFTELNINPFSS